MRISDWSSDVCSSDLLADEDNLTARTSALELIVKRRHEFAHFRLDLGRWRRGSRLGLDIFADNGGEPRGDDALLLRCNQNLGDPHAPDQGGANHEAHEHLQKGEAPENRSFCAARRLRSGLRQVELGLFNHDRVSLLAMPRSEEHTSELQSLMRISYAFFCLKKIIIKSII